MNVIATLQSIDVNVAVVVADASSAQQSMKGCRDVMDPGPHDHEPEYKRMIPVIIPV